MVPTYHLFWSAVWAGVAANAVERTRLYIRKAARANGGQPPPAAAHLTKAMSSLRALRALLASLCRRYESLLDDPEGPSALDFQTAITLLKVDSSELAVETVLSAMRACGLSSYRNDHEASLERHLRDVLSAPIMINNDRILANLATAMLMTQAPNLPQLIVRQRPGRILSHGRNTELVCFMLAWSAPPLTGHSKEVMARPVSEENLILFQLRAQPVIAGLTVASI
jgi:hypothetical protein